MKEIYAWKKTVGEFLSIGGESVFWLTWWLPVGLFLGGTPTLFGAFYPELAVVLPISGLGILLWWIGDLLVSPRLNPHKIIVPLVWLLAWGVNVIFSLSPETSMAYLLVWGVGLLALGTRETFFAAGVRRVFFTIGLALGFGFLHWFPGLNISPELLAIGAVWGLIFLAWESAFFGRFLWQVLFLIVVFSSGNLAIQLAALLVLLFGRRWFGVTSGRRSPFWFAIIVWGALFGWHLNEYGPFVFQLQPYWTEIFHNWQQLFFGVGEGQFLLGLQQFSPVLLDPTQLQVSESGAMVTFFEHGVWGTLLLLGLLLFMNAKRPSFLSWWLVFFWIFSSSLVVREEGIIFLLVFLATQVPYNRVEISQRIHSRRKRSVRPRKTSSAEAGDLPAS